MENKGKKGSAPTHVLRVKPEEGAKYWPKVGSAWERKDKAGRSYFVIDVPLLGTRLYLQERFEDAGDFSTSKVDDDVPF